jgi:hypothetical protein
MWNEAFAGWSLSVEASEPGMILKVDGEIRVSDVNGDNFCRDLLSRRHGEAASRRLS